MNVIQFIQPFFSLGILIFLYVSIGNLILRKSTIIIKFFSSFSLIYLFNLFFAFFSNKFIWYFFIFIIFLFLIYYWIKNLNKIKSYNLAIFVVSLLIISPLYILKSTISPSLKLGHILLPMIFTGNNCIYSTCTNPGDFSPFYSPK